MLRGSPELPTSEELRHAWSDGRGHRNPAEMQEVRWRVHVWPYGLFSNRRGLDWSALIFKNMKQYETQDLPKSEMCGIGMVSKRLPYLGVFQAEMVDW